MKGSCVDSNPCPHCKVKGSCVDPNPCPHGKVKYSCTACKSARAGQPEVKQEPKIKQEPFTIQGAYREHFGFDK
ncbi:hypothetical protein N9L76_06365 [bacterium]|nr:hypothetical protein [bacterium]